MAGTNSPPFARLVQQFFTTYLVQQRNVSPHTVASYRDTFRLLLRYVADRQGTRPAHLQLADFNAAVILAFLDALEQQRGNAPRSRNVRLAAIHTFFHYAASYDPGALATIHSVLAIPFKRYDRPLLGFLTVAEMQAVLDAPDRTTWSGARDHAMWATFYNTGGRVSEITALRRADLDLEDPAAVRIHGKGRKQRAVPLWNSTRRILRQWRERTQIAPDAPVFPNRAGHALTRTGVEDRLRQSLHTAATRCPSLQGQRVSPHTLRHTTAMHLLQSGVDMTVIALWLGHESPETTHQYVEADLEMKRRTLGRLTEPAAADMPWQPTDELLAFLTSL